MCVHGMPATPMPPSPTRGNHQPPRELGPVFSWRMGQDSLTTVVDYEAIRSLLQLGDGKVGGEGPCVCGFMQSGS